MNLQLLKLNWFLPIEFLAKAMMAAEDDERFSKHLPIRTSLIVNIDIENGVIETLNTLYKIV